MQFACLISLYLTTRQHIFIRKNLSYFIVSPSFFCWMFDSEYFSPRQAQIIKNENQSLTEPQRTRGTYDKQQTISSTSALVTPAIGLAYSAFLKHNISTLKCYAFFSTSLPERYL